MFLEKARHEITDQHVDLVEQCLKALGEWRAFIIGIDGWTHSGKSTLGRLLAWQLDMPCIETDFFSANKCWGEYDFDGLRRLVFIRINQNRPVIIEGIGLLHTLKQVELSTDFLVYSTNVSRDVADSEGYLKWISDYESEFRPRSEADFEFNWSEAR